MAIFEVFEASTGEQKEQIYSLRYKIFTQEQHKFINSADHEHGILKDALDDKAVHLCVAKDGEIIGAMRQLRGRHHISPSLMKNLNLDLFSEYENDAFSFSGRLFIMPEYRGSRALLNLLCEIYAKSRVAGVLVDILFCNPFLVKLYEQLGYRRYCPYFQDADLGFQIPMVLMTDDVVHLERIRSPFASLAKKWPSDLSHGEWFHKKFAQYETFVTPVTMSSDDFSAFLSTKINRNDIPLLDGFSEIEAQDFIQSSTHFKLQPETHLIRCGDMGQELYLILDGVAEVCREQTGSAGKVILSTLGRGDVFGEMSVLASRPRSADVVAKTELEVVFIDQMTLKRFIKVKPDMAAKLLYNLSQTLVERLEVTSTRFMEANSSKSVMVNVERLSGNKALNTASSGSTRHPIKVLDPLTGSSADFQQARGAHLMDRLISCHEWMDARRASDHWQFTRALTTGPTPRAALLDANRKEAKGVNFAVQDYLGLSTHPAIISVATETAARYGVHSAGSGALTGNSSLSWRLENALSEFLGMEHVLLFPTGWAAGYGVITGLVRHNDYIVIDRLAHACLQAGAGAATDNVYRFNHNDVAHMRSKLDFIRAKAPEAAILVVIESLYSMDSDTPDIRAMQEAAHEFGATLMVDVAHDQGNIGLGGTGHLGLQGMLGKVDIVMGSFSKTFASNGGFMATNHAAVKDYLCWYSSSWTFSNALSPIQCAVVTKAIEIIRSAEGEQLRSDLMRAVHGLRAGLQSHGIEVLGSPSAIVPVVVGDLPLIRTASRLLPTYGVLANTAEYPVVPVEKSRFRMQVMATHSDEDVRMGASGVARAIADAKVFVDSMS